MKYIFEDKLNMDILTPREKELYLYLRDKNNWKLTMPTYRQMADFLGVRSNNNVTKLLKRLRTKGFI